MSIIIISRGCYRRGSEVAFKAAAALGYECISREVLLEASKLFDIPELKLTRAIQDAPSLLDRFGRGRKNSSLSSARRFCGKSRGAKSSITASQGIFSSRGFPPCSR